MPVKPASQSAHYDDPSLWVDRYGDVLLRFASARVSGRDQAEDLVQETFLAAYRHRGKFDGKSGFGTWLVAILRHKIADHYRKSGQLLESTEGEPSAGPAPFRPRGKWAAPPARWVVAPDQLAENREFWTVFSECLSGLPAHLGQAFQIREMGTITVEEATKLMGITPKNLAVRLHRARLLLRECLENKWFRSKSRGST